MSIHETVHPFVAWCAIASMVYLALMPLIIFA